MDSKKVKRRAFAGMFMGLCGALMCGLSLIMSAIRLLYRKSQPDTKSDTVEQIVEPPHSFVGEPTLIDADARLARRLELTMQENSVTFDPFTLSILATVIGAVVQYCIVGRAVRIQQQVKRQPDGATAFRLRGKIAQQIRQSKRPDDAQLFDSELAVWQHTDAVMKALRESTPDELETWIKDVQQQHDTANVETPVNFYAAEAALDWSRIDD